MSLLEVKNLNIFRDSEGELFETLRNDDSLYSGKFGQNLVSIVNPRVIKGLHLHHFQTEYTTCLKGNILYVVVRENPGTTPAIESLEIGERNRVLVKTSPGIWHGYTSLDGKEAVVLYTMDKPYDSKDPDTEDKDPYFYGDIWKKNSIL